jgi:hypothetical protein
MIKEKNDEGELRKFLKKNEEKAEMKKNEEE